MKNSLTVSRVHGPGFPPDHASIVVLTNAAGGVDLVVDANSYYRPAYYQQAQRGWHPGRYVSAPIRWFGRRRFRPIARLFGRC